MGKKINIKTILGYNLRNLRESKNLTQEKLAEALNLQTYQTINRIENGKSFITCDLLEKMCKLFDVEPYVFFLNRPQTYTDEISEKFSQINIKLDEIKSFIRNSENSSKIQTE